MQDQIEELKQEKGELELIWEEEEDNNKKLLKENQKLQYAQNELVNMNQLLVESKEENKQLSAQVHNILEQLWRSEYSISKFLKALKNQDEIHEDHIRFYQDSEILLKKYYEEKLKYCFKELQLKNPVKVSQEIQTENTYEPELQTMHEQEIEKQSIQIGTYSLVEFISSYWTTYKLPENSSTFIFRN